MCLEQQRLRALLGCSSQRFVLLESLKLTLEIIENMCWLEFNGEFRIILLSGSQQISEKSLSRHVRVLEMSMFSLRYG